MARILRGFGGAGLVAALLLPAAASTQDGDDGSGPTIRLIEHEGRGAVAVLGVGRDALARAAADDFTAEEWRRVLAVRVADGPRREAPPMLGIYAASSNALVFVPRFGLKPGVRYRATFDPSQLPGGPIGSAAPLVAEIRVPAGEPPEAETRIDAVYPSSSELPENLLRFYVQFSAPMRQGESYRHVHLVTLGGEEVELPFLELAEELWDPEGRRLTLLLDPGRIKRGLVPHEEVGAALRAGTRYALVVDRGWRDARGAPLLDGHRKEFLAVPPDRSSPKPADWKLTAPRRGTREPVVLRLPGPLDQALLNRLVWVEADTGQSLGGTVETRDHETEWLFVPADAWGELPYSVRIDPALEDLAGNSVGRPFEVLSDGAKTARAADTPLSLSFTAKRP